MKMTKEEFLENILTRREAEQLTELSAVAFQHHLRKGNIKPCKEVGKGKGKVQLFWKEDLKPYLREEFKMNRDQVIAKLNEYLEEDVTEEFEYREERAAVNGDMHMLISNSKNQAVMVETDYDEEEDVVSYRLNEDWAK